MSERVIQGTNGLRSYEVASQIGRGAYATVFKGIDRTLESKNVALKQISIRLNEEGISSSSLREIGLLKQLNKYNHQNIVRLLDIFFGPRNARDAVLVLVFEHFNQDLSQYLARTSGPLDSLVIKSFMFQLLSGVDFMHSHRILHRDLKPENILVSDNNIIKIADFGLAKLFSYQMCLTSVVVTLFYRSPEVLLHNSYGTSVDIWSCGCIFAELHTKKPLFQGCSEFDQMRIIFETTGVPDESDWPASLLLSRTSFRQVTSSCLSNLVPQAEPEALELISKMLVNSQDKRIKAREALQDLYFQGIQVPSSPSNHPSASSPSSSSSSSAPLPSLPFSFFSPSPNQSASSLHCNSSFNYSPLSSQ